MHMRTKALVLRAVDYKESDKILTLLTQESGKLTASARGCRKKGSPVAAGVQLLAWSDLVLYEYRGRWTVKEAAVERSFWGCAGMWSGWPWPATSPRRRRRWRWRTCRRRSCSPWCSTACTPWTRCPRSPWPWSRRPLSCG